MTKAYPRRGLTPFDDPAYDFSLIPDHDNDFVNEDDFLEFAKSLAGAELPPLGDDLASLSTQSPAPLITALNDWKPIYQRARRYPRKKRKRVPNRGVDETREGYVYVLLKWPLLLIVLAWIIVLGAAYLLTRLYIFLYENLVTMRGKRETLRRRMRAAVTYEDWVAAAKEMDAFLGNDRWKATDEYAYYNSKTVTTVRDQMRQLRTSLETSADATTERSSQLIDDLRVLVEGSVKNNFVGTENPHLYSETYYGTKDLVQNFVNEVGQSLDTLDASARVTENDKSGMYKHLFTNYGRTALCLSGGATFAYYHFGVAKALLEANVLPQVITGTSGGALVAALLATRTDDELRRLLVPALAGRINACGDPFSVWFLRWWRTGARFDSIDWAKRCAWFCRGSLTFREAFERTGRILNVTCIPSEPSSPTLLANYLTAPDCVIWSAVLASAAVPGILNPVTLMRKTRSGKLAPYSFGNKWKDGSLRTDIPLKALNTHFNVNFSIVSQVNPHINLFFFSSRGAVGRPVTHRRGRGWRGGFLGSAIEQYLKLDLTKWLKILKHLELLPRYFGQDWSDIWLQRFSGTITIWPRVNFPSDFINILSDPPPERLARMIWAGQQSVFPKVKFIRNRMEIERRIKAGWDRLHDDSPESQPNAWRTSNRDKGHGSDNGDHLVGSYSEEDLQALLQQVQARNGGPRHRPRLETRGLPEDSDASSGTKSPSLGKRLTNWFRTGSRHRSHVDRDGGDVRGRSLEPRRSNSVIAEIGRQSRVFLDDDEDEFLGASASEAEDGSLVASADEWDGKVHE